MARNLHLLSLPLSLRAELPNWVSFYFWRAVTVRKLGLFPFMPAGIGSHASATTTPFEPSPNGCGAQLLSLWPALEPIRLAQSSSCKRNSRGGCSSFFSIFPLSTHFTAAFLAVWLSLFFGPQTLVSRLHLLRLPFYNGAGRKNDMEKLLGYYRLGFNRHTVQFWVHTERKVAKI